MEIITDDKGGMFEIKIVLNPGDPAVCDYCNVDLMGSDGIAASDCFLTEYGLMCVNCLNPSKNQSEIGVFESFKRGQFIGNYIWSFGDAQQSQDWGEI